MSANNYIYIRKKKKKFIVEECDADTCRSYLTIGEVDTLKEARKMANRALDVWPQVEYGIHYDENVWED